MSNWWDYENKNPIDLTKVKTGEKYFYLPGPGNATGVVTILSDNIKNGINVEYENKNQDVIFENETKKKLYNIIQKGGKRTRRNQKSKKQRKNRRKSNRRKH